MYNEIQHEIRMSCLPDERPCHSSCFQRGVGEITELTPSTSATSAGPRLWPSRRSELRLSWSTVKKKVAIRQCSLWTGCVWLAEGSSPGELPPSSAPPRRPNSDREPSLPELAIVPSLSRAPLLALVNCLSSRPTCPNHSSTQRQPSDHGQDPSAPGFPPVVCFRPWGLMNPCDRSQA